MRRGDGPLEPVGARVRGGAAERAASAGGSALDHAARSAAGVRGGPGRVARRAGRARGAASDLGLRMESGATSRGAAERAASAGGFASDLAVGSAAGVRVAPGRAARRAGFAPGSASDLRSRSETGASARGRRG